MNWHKIVLRQLYGAVQEYESAKAVYDAACFKGNFSAPRMILHGPLVDRLRLARKALDDALEEARKLTIPGDA